MRANACKINGNFADHTKLQALPITGLALVAKGLGPEPGLPSIMHKRSLPKRYQHCKTSWKVAGYEWTGNIHS
jgi:hypothetical protein